MDATITFDVEDPITPESDDVVKWQAEILSEEGVSGTFMITGDKARALEARGRDDVVDAIGEHDVGYHSDRHSVHPTVAEYLENAGWTDGIDEVRRRERRGIEAIERVFGVTPCTFATTGGSYAPQVVAAMDGLGMAYAYSSVSPIYSDRHVSARGSPRPINVFRFAETLTFGNHTFGFDDVFAETGPFEERLDDLADLIEEAAADGTDWIAPFGGHPTRIRATEFWDIVNFAAGRNPPKEEWEAPPLRPEAEMETARQNFRRFVRFLRDNELLELRTISDLKTKYAGQVDDLPTGALGSIAATALRTDRIPIDRAFSPGETLVAFAAAIQHADANGSLPDRVERTPVGAPLETPPETSGPTNVAWADLVTAATRLRDAVAHDGALPASIVVGGSEVNLASLYFALAEAVLAVASGRRPVETVSLRDRYPFPELARTIAERISSLHDRWAIHDPDLDSATIVAHTMRQTWTMKPARADD